MAFVPLLNRSFHSLLRSTLPPEWIAEAAAAQQFPAAGLVDRDTVAGAIQFYKKARAAGVRAVIGSQVRLEDHVLDLLVENQTGYRNLCRFLTDPVRDPLDPAGLICLYGPSNPPAEASLRRFHELFGSRFALAVAPHNDDTLGRSRAFVETARRRRIPLVATAAAHYRAPEDRLALDILDSMRTLTLLGQPHPDKLPPGGYHFHTAGEIERHFGSLPQAIANSVRIAERCQFEFPLGDIQFPEFPTDGEGAIARLRRLANEGLLRRYGPAPAPEKRARLERELAVIEEVGYAGYFLIYGDIVDWCARHGIATLARGSAAGSLVCYSLEISNVCPFRFGLSFERFLNRERMQFSKLADIDLDLPWNRRDEVVQYVFERYGAGHVAMVGAANTFQGRAAVADIAKVYGIPEREIRRFTEHLPHFSGDAAALVEQTPECRHLPVRQEPYATVLAMAGRFEGIPRHRMMHPCGLVISGRPLTDSLPLFLSAKGLWTTHFAMDDVEELGLLKMDLLGQAGLSVLRDALANIESNRGERIESSSIGWDDPLTWEMIAAGRARGVFHIESPAMTALLTMAGCRDIDCLTAVESIIRPGAANEGKKRAFARRHQGLEPVRYVHPSLEPLLADTYGLMAYEEHILLVANGFAGMSWGHADLLRRALVKNKSRRVAELGVEFRDCARRHGRNPEEIEAVWEMIEDFAGYMFNKAHSAAYAVEAFQGAWLKARYPVEFLAAVLSNRRGFYAAIVYVLEALRHGARFLPPDVHFSEPRFRVQDRDIRLPLDQIKGLGQEFIDRVHAARPFDSAGDFFRRARPLHAEWLALLKAGALDSLAGPGAGCAARPSLFWRMARLEAAGGATMFDPERPSGSDVEFHSPSPPVARWEHELLGFPVSCHPLEYFAPHLDWHRYTPAADLPGHLDGRVTVCGLIVCDRVHPTDRGPMKFLTLADYSGFVEVCLFPDVYRRFGHLTTRPMLAVTAEVDPFDNRRGFTLNAVALDEPR